MGVESCGCLHYGWIAPCNLFVGQARIEVVGNPRLQSVEVDVDQERVSACLNPRKRCREQIGQRRPVLPAVAGHCYLRKGETKRQVRLEAFVERAGLRLRRRRQFVELGQAPQIAEADRLRRCVVGLAYERRDGRADLNAYRVFGCREDARVGPAVRCLLTGLVLVAVEVVDADRVERLQRIAPASQ